MEEEDKNLKAELERWKKNCFYNHQCYNWKARGLSTQARMRVVALSCYCVANNKHLRMSVKRNIKEMDPVLRATLESVIAKQRERREHLAAAVAELTSSVNHMESVVKANVPDAEQSLVHAGSCKLPAFLMADDAVEALE
eukprot:775013-Prorocentrum_minimum.AAC.2